MNIDKVSSRARALADSLGVKFETPDINQSKLKAQKKIHEMKEYTSRREEYDAAISHILEVFSKDDILAFIASHEVEKTPK